MTQIIEALNERKPRCTELDLFKLRTTLPTSSQVKPQPKRGKEKTETAKISLPGDSLQHEERPTKGRTAKSPMTTPQIVRNIAQSSPILTYQMPIWRSVMAPI